MPNYSWIPIYKDIAKKILDYENNHNVLIDIITQLQTKGLRTTSLKDKNDQNQEISLADIDPFTFFSNWNRGVTDENRTKIIVFQYQVVPGGPKNPINIRRLPDLEQELAT